MACLSCLTCQRLPVSAFTPALSRWRPVSCDVWPARPDQTSPAQPPPPARLVSSVRLSPAPAAGGVNVRRDAKMSTMIRSAAPARVHPGQLLGARQLASVVRRLAGTPADWLGRVRLNPAGRWYERIHLDDSHEIWVISWLPGQATGFHDHGGAAGAFAVVWGTLMERRVVGAVTTGQVLAKPVGAGGTRAFGPRYIHDVRNAAASAVAVSVHAYSPPLTEMTRYDHTPGGLVKRDTEGAAAW